MAIFLKLCCCFFLLVHVAICHEPVVHNFVAQPFGQLLSEEVTLGSVKCKFTYKAVGGTNENWQMRLSKDGKEYTCIITRPEQSSYLFFLEFSGTIEGARMLRIEPYDNQNKMLPEVEYKLEGGIGKNADAFRSNIATVALVAEEI